MRWHFVTKSESRGPFGEEERIDVAPPQRHQVSELPAIAVMVTEHRLHRLRCHACAAATRAELPAEVPRGAFGPRLQVAVATLAARNRVSRRDTTELVRELFGAALSTGAVDAIVQRAGEALAEPHARLHGAESKPGTALPEVTTSSPS